MSIIEYIQQESMFNRIQSINEDSSNNHFNIGILDVESFVKVNEVQEITDPIFFIKDGIPSTNGLLSNEIFGITKDDRANIFGYIDLHDWFMDPLCFKTWSSMDSRIREIAHGTKTFSINSNGDFVEDEKGKTGIKFLKDNFDKIKIKRTDSNKRDKKIEFLKGNKDRMFIRKYLVIPAFYRDVNTNSGNIGVGQLNKYYSSLLISVRALKETQDYGLSMSNAVNGRIQETILNIYNCLCGTSSNKDDGPGLSKKKGIMRHSVLSKTADYGSRLVITAPELKVERLEDLMADIDYSVLPLASAITNFYPFIIFHVKRFFENEFGGVTSFPGVTKDGKIEYIKAKDPLIEFSDDIIKEELKRFIYGYSNRLSPVKVKIEDGREIFITFKGRGVTAEQFRDKQTPGESSLINRRLTWCDVFYMAAIEATRDKNMLVTRYPIDSAYNQIPTKIRISTMKDMERVYINNTYYQYYPKIREKDIGTNTSNKFIDSLNFSNLLLKACGGDYKQKPL